jgi:hypothetical protein
MRDLMRSHAPRPAGARRLVAIALGALASASALSAVVAGCGSTKAVNPSPDGSSSPTSSLDGAPSPGSDASVLSDAGALPPDASSASRWCVGSGDGPTDGGAGGASRWVYVADGSLQYAALDAGDHILDFSYAGYGGGGVSLPVVPALQTVSPSGSDGGGDDTPAIQAAIDAVSKLPLANGLRGAVLLAPGTFELAGSLSIKASGVVLRGSGSGSSGTLVKITGAPRAVLSIAGTGNYATVGTAATITDPYVPSGARSFHVSSAAGLAVGTAVLVTRPVTTAWVAFMGMDQLVRNGMKQTWIAPGSTIPSDRVITAVSGSEVTVDAPLSDSLDSTYVTPPGATVQAYTFAGRIEEVGLESIHFIAPQQTVAINNPTYTFLDMSAVLDAWISDVVAEEFTNGIVLGSTAKWVTIEDTSVLRAAPIDADAGLPTNYSIDGQQTLVQRSIAQANDMFAYATMSRAPGPNVLLAFDAKGSPIHVQPHERWATGVLADNVSIPTGSIDYINRGTDGSGHGWAIGFGVVWNSTASTLTIMQPPGSQNWAIGTTGAFAKTDTGIVDSPGVPVVPRSLYLAQLCERLGPGALANIGY